MDLDITRLSPIDCDLGLVEQLLNALLVTHRVRILIDLKRVCAVGVL